MSSRYENPLCVRYAGEEMQRIFSDDNRYSTWRKLWVALAESERELGLPISEEQIEEMKAHLYDINYEVVREKEKELRHDVMAHIHAYGEQCPLAKPIIHLGATSCYVGDNTNIILMKSGLIQIRKLIFNVLAKLYDFANSYKKLPCLSYTHFQPAQPTTVGKRATLWIQDLMLDLEQLDFVLGNLKLLGCRGTTGTAASFLALFEGDHEKVKLLDQKIAEKMGFDGVYDVSGQTYPRKVDYYVLSVLSGIAQSASKFSYDIRLLSHLKEVEEPSEAGQIGSSAMPYKKNPMRSERITSLARYVMAVAQNPAFTAGTQWLERTLDDSANGRISIPEAFLATDAILSLYLNIVSGLKVYPKMIKKHLDEELPYMATENILMYCVKKGGDRQELHERIRVHSRAVAEQVKQEGGENDLLKRILSDKAFGLTKEELDCLTDPSAFIGRAKEQTEEFLCKVTRLLNKNKNLLGVEVQINV